MILRGWGSKLIREGRVYYEVWSKIEKVLQQWEQSCIKTIVGSIEMTVEWSLIKIEQDANIVEK